MLAKAERPLRHALDYDLAVIELEVVDACLEEVGRMLEDLRRISSRRAGPQSPMPGRRGCDDVVC